MEKQCSNSFNLGSPLREVSCIQVSIIRFYLLCASPHVIGPSHMFGKANQRYTLMEENREIKTLTHLMPAAGGKWNQGLMVSTGVGVSQELWVMPQGSSLYYFPWLLLQLMCLHMRVDGAIQYQDNTKYVWYKKRFAIHLKFKMKGMSRERVCSTKLGETEG